jgi:hypothetical protein
MSYPVAIYGLFDPRTGELRYVGKAVDVDKRLKGHLREDRRKTPLYSWIDSLRECGLSPEMSVICTCSVGDWQEVERDQIAEARLRGERLLNLADGGDEPTCPREVRAENGRRVAETRDRRRRRLMRDLGDSLKRGFASEATKAKMRERMDLFGQFAAFL